MESLEPWCSKPRCLWEPQCSEVDPESVGNMDLRNRTGTGTCEKSSSNCKHIYMYILRASSYCHQVRWLFSPSAEGFFTPSRFNKDLILVKINYCGYYFVTLIHPSLTTPLIYETYKI
jgi:hypothetical protein